MGDRYELDLNCAYCKELNKDIWYAPTCGAISFNCSKCKKENFIKEFQSIKAEEVTSEDLFDEFMDGTNVVWDDKDLKRINEECEETIRKIKEK